MIKKSENEQFCNVCKKVVDTISGEALISPSMKSDEPKGSPVAASQSEDIRNLEAQLLDCGVVSIDGLEGIEWGDARAVAEFSAPLASKHYRMALAAGILNLK